VSLRRLALGGCLAALALAGRVAVAAPAAGQDPAHDETASPALRVGWSEFKPLYDAGAVVVVDVRDESSYRSGHIPGARSVPADRIEQAAAELAGLGKPVVTYCACPSEHSSAEAALALRRRQVDARALVGGWVKWYEETGGRAERGRPSGGR
jgi:rhodanese-related sulfurtransferase